MVQCQIVTHLSLVHMIVNVGNIAGNEKTIVAKENLEMTYTIVAKENLKMTYTQDLSWIFMFLS